MTTPDHDKLSPADAEKLRGPSAAAPSSLRHSDCAFCATPHDHYSESPERSEALLRALGRLPVPDWMHVLHGRPGGFAALHRTLEHATQTILAGYGLLLVDVPERDSVLLVGDLPEGVSIAPLAAQLGAKLTRERTPRAGEWCCGPRCLALLIRREVAAPSSAIVNDAAVRAVDRVIASKAATGRVDETPSGDVVVQCAGGCGEQRPCPARVYRDDMLWENWLETNGFRPHGHRGAVHRTCRYEAERAARPLPPVVDRAEMVKRFGPHFVPESNAARIYSEVHGGKTPQEVEADLEAAKRATAAGARPYRQRRGGGGTP